MKLKNLLILGCLVLGINSLAVAQGTPTNPASGWNGNGAGTAAINTYGWDAVSPAGERAWTAPGGGGVIIFDVLNGGGVRFRDITEQINNTELAANRPAVTLNGVNWTGRVLYLRWDAGGATLNHVFSHEVTLEGGREYNFSMLYHWWDNGDPNHMYTVSISRDKLGTENIASQQFESGDIRRVMKNATMPVTVPAGAGGQYFITFKSSSGSLLSIAEMSLMRVSTTNSSKDLLASNYTIYPNPSNRADGLFIAANEAAELLIYNVTGQLQKQVSLKAAQDSKVDISDLSAGMYVAKVVTSKGSFNKTLVVQ